MTAKLLFFDYFCKSIRTCLTRNVKFNKKCKKIDVTQGILQI